MEKFADKKYRDAYVSNHLREFLAAQIRSLRFKKEMSQAEFAKLLEKPQSVVSRLENPDYGKVTLQTLLDVANKLDIGLVVRFVDFPTFLRLTSDFSESALSPVGYNQFKVDEVK